MLAGLQNFEIIKIFLLFIKITALKLIKTEGGVYCLG